MDSHNKKWLIAGAALLAAVVVAFMMFSGTNYASQLESGKREQRLAAIAALEKENDDSAVEILQRYIADSDIQVARRTLMALGRMKKSASVDILRPALSDQRKELREAAVVAIGSRGLEGDPAALRQMLKTDPESTVRMAAMSVLGEMRDWDSMAAFAVELESKDEDVQTAAAMQMLRIGGLEHQGFRPGATPQQRQTAIQFLRVHWKGFKDSHQNFLEYKRITGR